MKELGWPGEKTPEAAQEKKRRSEVLRRALRACQEGRRVCFDGVYYLDTWDMRDAIVRSGQKFSDLEIDQDDGEEFLVKTKERRR